MTSEKKANRRLVGFAMIGSAALMTLLATLIFTGGLDVAESSRVMIGGVLGFVVVLDLVLAVYFIVSDPS
jgi:hypothetical protein